MFNEDLFTVNNQRLSKKIGQIIKSVTVQNNDKTRESYLEFIFEDNQTLLFAGCDAGCGNEVFTNIKDICGDLNDLIGSPLLIAEERSQTSKDNVGEGTWTFYEFATNKGSVSISWMGESNGFYSEKIDVLECETPFLKKTKSIDLSI